mgnify:CR=1 FL=1|tara:strand:- start:64956 stop:65855 length:900 start_codon:yes stop_codon:yes gene_type:complete
MRYTIAIPSYNNEGTIREAINSCLNQIGTIDYELLISDDGSTDSSIKIVEEFSEDYRVRIIKHSGDSSLYENHNKCLREAKGDYVVFCHADDTLFSDAILKIDLALSCYNYPGKIVCFGRSFFRDFYNNFKQVGELNNIVSGISAQELFQKGGITPAGTCYSRQSFLNNGGFLPMRNSITPSDMTSMIKYSLDGAEFLMLDRIIFKREFASTACNINKEASFESKEHAIEELSKVLSKNTMETLFSNVISFNSIDLQYMLILSRYSTDKKLKLKLKLKSIFKNPLILRHKFIRKLLLEK